MADRIIAAVPGMTNVRGADLLTAIASAQQRYGDQPEWLHTLTELYRASAAAHRWQRDVMTAQLENSQGDPELTESRRAMVHALQPQSTAIQRIKMLLDRLLQSDFDFDETDDRLIEGAEPAREVLDANRAFLGGELFGDPEPSLCGERLNARQGAFKRVQGPTPREIVVAIEGAERATGGAEAA